MAILIKGAEVVVTMDGARSERSGCDIRVEGGVITAVGPGLPVDGAEVIAAQGCVVTPGLVNTHHHLYQTLTRAVPGGRMRCCLGGSRRSTRSGRGLRLSICASRRLPVWRSWP